MAFLPGMDVVGGFIGVGQRFVVVDLIAEVALGIRQIVAIPRLAAAVSYTHLDVYKRQMLNTSGLAEVVISPATIM